MSRQYDVTGRVERRWLCRPTAAAATAGILVVLNATAAFAAGFQLQEQSASGLGLAYAGMSAAVQDASTAFWNPAGMSLQGGTEVSGSAAYIVPSTVFSSSGSTYDAFGPGGNGGVHSWVPALYAHTAVGSHGSVGLALNAPFGLSTDWQAPWAGMFHALHSKVETLNINPVGAYQLGEHLWLGAGVSYQQLKASFTNAVTPLIPTAQARLDASDWAWGWNVGGLWEPTNGTRIGLTYRSAARYSLTGSLGFNAAALAPLAGSIAVPIKLPQTASVGLSQALTPDLRLLADYSWTGWNSIQALRVTATSGVDVGAIVLDDELRFANSWRIGTGLEYSTGTPWLLRLGVALDRSPVQDAYRTPRLPDNDRTWLAVGARYALASNASVDLGYSHLWIAGGSSSLAPLGPVPGSLIGSYREHVDIAAVQVSVRY